MFRIEGDSIFVQLPIFNTALAGKKTREGIHGEFIDRSRKGDYRIPFTAAISTTSRFRQLNPPTVNVDGKWQVRFSPGTDAAYDAIGLFEQEGSQVQGTFLTTTGDYRFLEGNVSGDSLLLSCFDGAHAFLFKAKVHSDSMSGSFWSGVHWKEDWTGLRNDTFQLPDPTALTFLKPGYDRLTFTFNNLEGHPVSLSDKAYENKVVIVQIMGSWCPNCMDETAYLVSLYGKFHQQGLEVISLAFERSDNEATNLRSLKRLKEHFDIPYQILLAGRADKAEAAQKLPMLNHVLSFPTTIFIDRKGKVRRVHTGFSGPGTGEYYQEFVDETDRYVTQLLFE